jgi:transcriptional regulator with XRE-family HTH domain
MSIKKKKSNAVRFLEGVAGPLSLSRLIEAIRLGEEKSQVEFAKLLGISKSHLCDIEKGRKTINPARAVKFAKLLGYSPEQFVRLSLQDIVSKEGLHFKVNVEVA